MALPQTFLIAYTAAFGLIIGSFLNVCIYRIPQKLSIVGRSFCPHCRQMIPIYRNVPVLSYLLQRGLSACCREPISPQYPLVEALTGLLSVAVLLHAPSFPEYFLWFLLFVCPLVVVSVIDLKLRIIPDVISLPFIGVGVGAQLYLQYPDLFGALKFSILGLIAGGGVLLLLAEIFSRIKGTDAMGGGDIKLAAMLGAFLGWKSLVFIFFASSFLALVYVVIMFILRRNRAETTIPFGPFLSMAGIIYYLYGRILTDFYFQRGGFPYNPLFD